MKRALIFMAVPALLAAMAIAAEVNLTGVKCIVGGEPAKASVSSDYMDGRVFFCCADCQKSFKADSAKYAAKANHQLVATGQATQTQCPVSGEPISKDKFVEVAGAKVYFCCDNCKNSVAKATGNEQLKMAFGDAAWKKAGFKVAK